MEGASGKPCECGYNLNAVEITEKYIQKIRVLCFRRSGPFRRTVFAENTFAGGPVAHIAVRAKAGRARSAVTLKVEYECD